MTPSSNNGNRQVATRVSLEAYETLEVVRLVEGAESMQELLRPVIEDYATRMAAEPEIQDIRGKLQASRDRRSGVDRIRPTSQPKSSITTDTAD